MFCEQEKMFTHFIFSLARCQPIFIFCCYFYYFKFLIGGEMRTWELKFIWLRYEGERRKIKQRRKVYHFHWVAVVLREGKIESSVLFIVKLPFPSPSSSSSSLRVFEVQGCCWIILSPLNINLSLLRHA